MKRYKSTKILGGGPPGKIVQCQSFNCTRIVRFKIGLKPSILKGFFGVPSFRIGIPVLFANKLFNFLLFSF